MDMNDIWTAGNGRRFRLIHTLVTIPMPVDDSEDPIEERLDQEEQVRDTLQAMVTEHCDALVTEFGKNIDGVAAVQTCEVMDPGHPDGFNIRIK